MSQQQTDPIVNNSGLKPLGRAVLVKPYKPKAKQGVIELPDFVNERMVMVDTRVVVIAIGEHCWPDEPPRAAVGDRVFISQYAGAMVRGTKDNEVYRAVNDRDIYLQIVDEETENA